MSVLEVGCIIAAIILIVLIYCLLVVTRDRNRLYERQLASKNLIAQISPNRLGLKEGRVVEANTAACTLFGFSEGTLLGTDLCDFVTPRDVRGAKAWLVDVRRRLGNPPSASLAPAESAVFCMRHRQGHDLWIRLQCLGQLDEKLAHTLGDVDFDRSQILQISMLDVSQEYLSMDRELREQQLRGVGVLAAGVAHDFNNLLTVITGFSERLAPSEAQTKILNATDDAAALVQTLTAFSVPSLHESPRVELAELVEKSLGELSSQGLKNSRVHVNVSASKLWVGLSAQTAQQLLTHLVMNAREALDLQAGETGPAGLREQTNVWVDLERVTGPSKNTGPLTARETEYVLLTISDDGGGMAPHVLRHALDPFFSTKQDPPGAGLGLTTVHGLVSRAGGFLELESETGKGASVAVYLPIVGGGEDALQVSSPCTEGSLPTEGSIDLARKAGVGVPQQGKILVIESDERVAEVVARSLVGTGYSVTIRSSAKNSRSLIQQDKPELIVADVMWPSGPGADLLSVLKTLRVESIPPILFLCGYTPEPIGEIDLPEECIEFLAKPFRAHELLASVERLLLHSGPH